MDIQPALQVVLIGLGAAVLTELLGWLTVYRTASFRQRRNELNVASKRLEEFRQQQPGGGGGGASSSALTASPGGGAKKGENREKKEKRLEEAVKGAIAEFSSLKMKANLSAGLVNILAFRQISSTYEGVPVAHLPFTPPSWMANLLTHRGLPGTDLTECSALFLYLLASMFFKMSLTAALGWGPSRASERAMRAAQQPAAAAAADKYKAA